MLNGLDQIVWAEVQGAYGAATEMPELLRRLLSADSRERLSAFEQLEDIINHQGGITPAALVTAPFLVEIATAPTAPDRGSLVRLLADLSVGGSHERYVANGLLPLLRDDPALAPIRTSVLGALDAWISLLGASAPELRAPAAVLLAMLPEAGSRSRDALRRVVDQDRNDKARASAVLALALLAHEVPDEGDGQRFRQLQAKAKGLTHTAAGLALAIVDPDPLPDELRVDLLGVVTKRARPVAGFPWFAGRMDELTAILLMGAAVQHHNVDLLRSLLDEMRGSPLQRMLAPALVDVAFADDGGHPADLRLATELSPTQRDVLEQLVKRDLHSSAEDALRVHGLVCGRPDLERFLGLKPPGPIDRVVNGQPLWRFAAAVLNHRTAEQEWMDTLRKALSPEEIVAACEHATMPVAMYSLQLPWPPVFQNDVEAARRPARVERLIARTLVGCVPRALLVKTAERVAADDAASECWSASVAFAIAEAVHADGDVLDARLDPLLLHAMAAPTQGRRRFLKDAEPYREDLRHVLEYLTLERRAALVALVPFDSCQRTGERGCFELIDRGAWAYIDLCPTPAMVARTLEAMAAWKPDEPAPEERAVEVLGIIGPADLKHLEEAARSSSPRVQAVARRALDAIRQQQRGDR
jgi:hypothetical protein